MLKNFVVRHRGAGDLLHERGGGRALELVAVELRRSDRAHERIARRARRWRRSRRVSRWNCTQSMHHGARPGRRAPRLEVEQDRVADQVALVVHGDELLGLVDLEVREAVDADVRSSRSASGPVMNRSVMWWDWSSSAQVSTHDRCSERQLLNSGVTGKVRRAARVAQQLDRAPGAGECGGEALGRHDGRALHRVGT